VSGPADTSFVARSSAGWIWCWYEDGGYTMQARLSASASTSASPDRLSRWSDRRRGGWIARTGLTAWPRHAVVDDFGTLVLLDRIA